MADNMMAIDDAAYEAGLYKDEESEEDDGHFFDKDELLEHQMRKSQKGNLKRKFVENDNSTEKHHFSAIINHAVSGRRKFMGPGNIQEDN